MDLQEDRSLATHVIVYQMGKVASAAITSALKSRGFDAHQCHLLGEDKLVSQLKNALNPNLTAHEETHTMGQFFQNVELHRLVAKYQRKKFGPNKRLKIISLVRNPYDWYVSEFIQNFPAYEPGVLRWFAMNFPGEPQGTPLSFKMQKLQEAISSLAVGVRPEIGSQEFFRSVTILERRKSRGIQMTAKHVRRLCRPHTWFDNFFLSLFKIDIYDYAKDINRGHAIAANDYADFLFLKYEMLENSSPVFEDFLEIENFGLNKKNVSSKKYASADIRSGIEAARSSDFLSKIGKTKYSCEFDYDKVLCNDKNVEKSKSI